MREVHYKEVFSCAPHVHVLTHLIIAFSFEIILK